MGQCAKCGATVIDAESYRKAYCSVLEASSKDRHILNGFRRLFDQHLYYSQQTQEYTLAFDRREAAVLGIEKEIK